MKNPPTQALPYAFEQVGDALHGGRLVLTCEHATNALPPPLSATAADRPLLDDHWGWDLGAADVTRGLARRAGAVAVLSAFSRLVCDPNRAADAPDLVVREAEGHALSFNAGVAAAETARRLAAHYAPYHAAIDACLGARRGAGLPCLILSVHSFTPSLNGRRRPMEAGVLFDDHDELAERFAVALERQGFVTARNEPYSGKLGLVYAAQRHGRAHGVQYLELELRNDQLRTPADREAVTDRVAAALASLPEAGLPSASPPAPAPSGQGRSSPR